MGTGTRSAKWLSAASASALAVALAAAPMAARAQLAAANASTQLHNAANGVPVVNIAKPNASGLSVNQYNSYNVGSEGLILNNATAAEGNSTGQVSTQLGGLIAVNPNLTTSASVILNQVISTNPSVLAGYTEVAGGRADVIVANPNGITCGGCGFINTSALTLTTGTPSLNSSGALTGFNVTAGVLTINGTGLDASTTDYAALLGRKIALQGPTYGGVLDVVGGAEAWDYNAHTATAMANVGNNPDYAIDSSALGGMYANRIRLIATDAGVGVRLLGDAAASGDDLTITAAGDIIVGGNISAQRNLSISTSATDASALTASNANLTAGGDLTVTTPGGVSLIGGSLVANGDLSLSLGTLSDVSASTGSANENQRYAGETLTFSIAGTTTLSGTSYGAAGNVTGQFGNLSDTGFGDLYSDNGALSLTATQGDMALGGYALSSNGTLDLTASHGAISTTAGANEGVVSAAGLSLTAANGLTNGGTISANNGAVTLALGGDSTNSGVINGSGAVTLTDASGGSSESFTNSTSGQLLAGGALSAQLTNLTNNGAVQALAGSQITGSSLTNSGLFIASTAAADGTLTFASLTNSGTLQSARNLTLNVSGTLNNSGTLVATDALTLDGGAAATNAASGAASGATVTATLASLQNAGQITSAGDLGLTVAGDLANTGTLGANGTLTASAATLENTGAAAVIQSQTGGTLTASGALTNGGAIYLANASGSGAVNAATLTNPAGGVLNSQGDLTLTLSGASLTNAGDITAANGLTINGTGAALALNNNAGGYLQAGSAAGDTLTIGGNAVALTTASGSVATGNAVDMTLAGLTNAGALNANAGLTLIVSGAAGNTGSIVAGGALQASAASLTNGTGGGIQGGAGVSLTAAGALENDGVILTAGATPSALTLNAATLNNTAGAYLQSDGALSVNLTGASLTNAGSIDSAGAMGLHGGATALTLLNTGTGVISAQAASGAPVLLTIDGAGGVTLENQASGVITGDQLAFTLASAENDGQMGANVGSSTLTVSGALINFGTLILSADPAGSGTINAASLTNHGTLASNNDLTLNLTSGLTNTADLQASGDLAIAFGANNGTIQNASSAQMLAGGALTVTGVNTAFSTQSGEVSGATIGLTLASLNNVGTVVSGGNLTLTSGGAVSDGGNLVAGGTLSLTAASLTLPAGSGVAQSQVGGTITLTGDLTVDSSAAIYLANQSGAGVISAADLTLQQGASLVSQGKLNVNLSGTSLDSGGTIYAGDDLTISGSGALAITNETSGAIETAAAGPGVTGKIILSGANVSLTNKGLILGNALDWATLASFTNQGMIQSRGDFALDLTGLGQNSGTIYADGGAVLIATAGFDNLAGGVIQGDTGATFSLGAYDFSNAGVVLANGTGGLTINAANLSNLAAGATPSAATLQSSADLTLNLSGAALNNTGDIIAAGALGIHDPTNGLVITNSAGGTIAAQGPSGSPASLTIDGQATRLLNDAGSSIYGDSISLTLNSDVSNSGFDNYGTFVGGAGTVTISTTHGAENDPGGVFFTGGALTLNAVSFENSGGATFEPNSATLNLSSGFDNGGFTYIPGNLYVYQTTPSTTTFAFTNTVAGLRTVDGLLQVGGTLNLSGGGIDLENQTGATIVAGSLSGAVNVDEIASIENWGVIQGTSNFELQVAGDVTNYATGKVIFANSSNLGLLYAKDLYNYGTIEGYGPLELAADNGVLTNYQGGTLAADVLYLGASGSGSDTITNAGQLSATTGISVGSTNLVFLAGGQSNSETFTFEPSTGGSLTMGSNSEIQATGSFQISVPTATFADDTVKIIAGTAGGISSFSIGEDFTNSGVIYSGTTLNVSAPTVTNSATGLLGAGGALTISASSEIDNLGEIYGAGSVTLNATGEIFNEATTTNAASNTAILGSIDSGGTISATAGAFINYSNINATGAITIDAQTFVNSVAGDWSRVAGAPVVSAETQTGLQVGSCVAATGQTCQATTTTFDSFTSTTTQTFANGLSGPAAGYMPEIVSSSAVTVENFTNGYNTGTLVSAPTVTLNGASGSQFTIDTLAQESAVTTYRPFTQVTTTFKNNGSSGYSVLGTSTSSPNCSTNFQCTVSAPVDTFGAAPTQNGIFAGTVDGGGFALNLTGGAASEAAGVNGQSANVQSRSESASGGAGGSDQATTSALQTASVTTATTGGTSGQSGSVVVANTLPGTGSLTTVSNSGQGSATGPLSGATPASLTAPAASVTVNGKPAVAFGGTTIVLPTSPNGLFVVTPGSNNHYLVETNPLYTTPVTSVSSNLLAQDLGIDPDSLEERLGDADYEAYLVSQQLLGQTGSQLLGDYANLTSELTGLYANAAADAKSDGLVLGQALTSQQAANLPNDMIWLVSTVVDGQTVLAPVVYLSAATKASLVSGSGIIADNVNLTLTSLTNQGGLISGAQTNNIVATGDVNNLAGGVIAGGQVYLQSTAGVVNNLNSTIAGVQSAAVVANGALTNTGGTITAQNVGVQSVTDAVDLHGGTIAATNSLALSQYKDIDITGGATNISGKNIDLTSTGGSINILTSTQTTSTANKNPKLSPTVTTQIGPTASVTASQDLSLNAAKNINVSGGNVSAGQDLSLNAGGDINVGTIVDQEASASKKGGTSTSSSSSTNIGSNISAGGNLVVQSGGNTNIVGSTLTVGGDAAIQTGGQLNIGAATNTSQTNTTTVHNGLFSDSSKSVTVNTATDAASNIQIGGSAYLQTNGDINVTGGTNLGVGGNLVTDTNGHNLNVVAGNNATTTNTVTHEAGLGVGGGLYGSTTSTTNDAETTNDASTIKVGGQLAALDNANVLIQGSNVSAAGGGVIQATGNVNVLAGQNTSTVTSHTVSECVLCTSSSSSAGASASKGATATVSSDNTGGSATVDANAQAQAQGQNSSSLSIYQKTVTDTASAASNSVGSNVSLGANSLIQAGGNVTVQGSNVATTSGDLTVLAKNVNVLAAQNTSTSSTTTKTTGFGIYVDSSGSASAGADATAGAGAGGSTGLPSATATATAGANAQGQSTVTFGARQTTSSASSNVLTNSAGALGAQGNLTVVAQNNITTVGSNLTAGGNITEAATNISNLAAIGHDIESTSSSQKTEGAFVQVGGSASANATAGGTVGLAPGSTSVSALAPSASATVSVNAAAGVRVESDNSGSTTGSTTVNSSNLTAGGNITRIASNAITDQGTQLNAGGNILQAATTITDQAVSATKATSSNSSSVDFQLGVQANASATATLGASASKQAGAGIGESLTTDNSSGSSSKSTQVVSNYTAGGTVTTISSGNTTLSGANISGANGVTIQAGTLNYNAATNTKTVNGSDVAVNQDASVDFVNKSASLDVSVDQATTAKTKTAQVGGSVTSGNGQVNIVTTSGDATLVGTQVSGATGANVVALNGNVNLLAAQTVKSETDETASAELDLAGSKSTKTTTTPAPKGGTTTTTANTTEGSASPTAGFSTNTTTKVTNQVATINGGSGGAVVQGTNVTLQGAQVTGATANVVVLGGQENLQTVNDTTTTTGGGFSAGTKLSASKTTTTTTTTDKNGNVTASNTATTKNKGVDGTTAGYSSADGTTIDNTYTPTVAATVAGTPITTTEAAPTQPVVNRVTTAQVNRGQPAGTPITTTEQPSAFVQPQILSAQIAPTGGAVPQAVQAGTVIAQNPAVNNGIFNPLTATGQTVGAVQTGLRQGAGGSQGASASGGAITAQALAAPTVTPLSAAGLAAIRAPAAPVAAIAPSAAPVAAVAALTAAPASQPAVRAAAPTAVATPAPLTLATGQTGPAISAPTYAATHSAVIPVATSKPVQIAQNNAVNTNQQQSLGQTTNTGTTSTVANNTVTTNTPPPPPPPTLPNIITQTSVQQQSLGQTTNTATTNTLAKHTVTTNTPPPPPTLPNIITQTTVQQQSVSQTTDTVATNTVTTSTPPPPPPPTPPNLIKGTTVQPQGGGQKTIVTASSAPQPPSIATGPTASQTANSPMTGAPNGSTPRTGAPATAPAPQSSAHPPIQVLGAPVLAGKTVTATGPANSQLPCWLTIDPRTGAISGSPSDADAAANTPVIVVEQVPQADGSTRSLTITVTPDLFGRGGSECNTVRTIPTARGPSETSSPAVHH